MANVKVFLAPSTAFASPPENNSWYPERIIMKSATVPANPTAQRITLATSGKMQLRVKMAPSDTESYWQPLYITKE